MGSLHGILLVTLFQVLDFLLKLHVQLNLLVQFELGFFELPILSQDQLFLLLQFLFERIDLALKDIPVALALSQNFFVVVLKLSLPLYFLLESFVAFVLLLASCLSLLQHLFSLLLLLLEQGFLKFALLLELLDLLY